MRMRERWRGASREHTGCPASNENLPLSHRETLGRAGEGNQHQGALEKKQIFVAEGLRDQ